MIFGRAAILGFRWMIVVAFPYWDSLEPPWNASRLRSLTDLTASEHNLHPRPCPMPPESFKYPNTVSSPPPPHPVPFPSLP